MPDWPILLDETTRGDKTILRTAFKYPGAGPERRARMAYGRRFDVYRNNVASSLTDALEVGFSAIAKLVGQRNFRVRWKRRDITGPMSLGRLIQRRLDTRQA